ncbi:hypothetical protein [Sorangium sp. So ce388]|uniref:hypothetical protein n=1 Tax=Sorangium sp. So ce388 TaxID=3133309 RepID=UPI003F5C8399
MSEQHEVTVYDRVPATARVSWLKIEAYLRRTGWIVRWGDEARDLTHWGLGEHRVWTDHDSDRMAERVADIAAAEQRQPSAVLADIAKEESDHA